MDFIYAIILGIVQGLTEFLPVSSSGHLAVIGSFLDVAQPGVLFETMLHMGTALAILWFFREKILKLKINDLVLIVVGSIPAALIGLLFADQIEGLFSILKLVGIAFLFSSYLNFQTDKHNGRREEMDKLDAIFIGVMQAVAILPGVSRSGATIFAGTKMNLSKTRAAEFSFRPAPPRSDQLCGSRGSAHYLRAGRDAMRPQVIRQNRHFHRRLQFRGVTNDCGSAGCQLQSVSPQHRPRRPRQQSPRAGKSGTCLPSRRDARRRSPRARAVRHSDLMLAPGFVLTGIPTTTRGSRRSSWS